MSKLMELVEEYGILRYRLACIGERNHASLAERAEARKAEIRAAVAELERDAAAAQYLYGLLDDIDTASDMAKSSDAAYRKLVEQIQARRWAVVDREKFDACSDRVSFKSMEVANGMGGI